VNLPDQLCDGFKFARDCGSAQNPGYCPVSAISNYTQRVSDLSLPHSERQEGLKFLLHFMAEITQPLHIGFTSDRGGNKISVIPPWDHPFTKAGKPISTPRVRPLHVIWDSHILQYHLNAIGSSWTDWAESLARSIDISSIDTTELKGSPLDYAISTVTDSSQLACTVAYKSGSDWITSGDSLDAKYYNDAVSVVTEQIIKAGISIAQVINEIGFKVERQRHVHMSTDDDDHAYGEVALASSDYDDEFHMF